MKTITGDAFTLLGALFFALTPLALVLSHQTVTYTVLILALGAVVAAVAAKPDFRSSLAALRRPVAMAVMAFALLALASAAWAPDPSRAAAEGLLLLFATAVLALFAHHVAAAAPEAQARLRRVAALAFLVAAVLLVLQVGGGFLIKWEVAERSYGAAVARNNLNVATAGIVIALWPVVHLLSGTFEKPAGRICAAAMLLLVLATVVLARGLAPKVVLPLGVLVLLLAWWRPAVAALATGAAILAMTVALMFVPAQLYRSPGFMEIPWLDTSSKYRIEIWDLAIRWAREKPLLGHGAGASRSMPPLAEVSKVHGGVRRIPMYPHNVLVQTALELGIAGVAAALAVCGFLLRSLLRLPAPLAAPAFAAFASGVGVWLIGYPLWRSAWISWLGFCLLCVVLIATQYRQERCSAS